MKPLLSITSVTAGIMDTPVVRIIMDQCNMCNPKHLPKTPELMLDHIMEEASEVIKACVKIKRFGLNDTKLADLASEVDDVQFTFKRYKKAMKQ